MSALDDLLARHMAENAARGREPTLDEAKQQVLELIAFAKQQTTEGARLLKENTILRGLVQCNPEWKCIYGYTHADGTPLKSMAECPLGFPGCACGDDLINAYCEPSAERPAASHVAPSEAVLSIVDLLLSDVAEKPDRLARAQEIARRDIPPLLAPSSEPLGTSDAPTEFRVRDMTLKVSETYVDKAGNKFRVIPAQSATPSRKDGQ